jgi:hypothetical protein
MVCIRDPARSACERGSAACHVHVADDQSSGRTGLRLRRYDFRGLNPHDPQHTLSTSRTTQHVALVFPTAVLFIDTLHFSTADGRRAEATNRASELVCDCGRAGLRRLRPNCSATAAEQVSDRDFMMFAVSKFWGSAFSVGHCILCPHCPPYPYRGQTFRPFGNWEHCLHCGRTAWAGSDGECRRAHNNSKNDFSFQR